MDLLRRFLRLLCVGGFAGTVVVDAIRHLSPPDSQLKVDSLYHAGHGASHVTRLHRYDHSGMDVFLEREAVWHNDWDSKDSPFSFMQSGLEHDHSFIQLSTAQMDALNVHQHVALKQTVARLASRANSSTFIRSKMEKYEAHAELLARASPQAMAAIQQSANEHTGLHNGRAVTGLSSLSSQYVGPIGVGTKMKKGMPGEESNIWCVFDTGSTNLWVSSDLCEEGPCAKEDRKRYNHTESMTFRYPEKSSTLTVHFGTGTLIGPQGVDDLHVGPFTVYNQTFAMIKNEDGSVFDQVPFEGILGLAFPAMSANKVRPFFDTVIDQKGLEHNEFAVYFSKDTPSANAIFWGGVDNRFFNGPIEYFPVTDPYYWALDLHSFKIGKECLFGPGCAAAAAGTASSRLPDEGKENPGSPYAIVDTGTTYFTAEEGLFDEIMERIPAATCRDLSDQSHPSIVWTLKNAAGGLKDFIFTKEMYMTQRGEGSGANCSPAFMKINVPKKHGPAMLFGEVFLRSYYAVFDRGDGSDSVARVGFAPALHSKDLYGNLKELTHSQPSFEETRQALRSKLRQMSAQVEVTDGTPSRSTHHLRNGSQNA